MPINDSLRELLDKDWEEKPLREIIKASPEVLQGISPMKAELLEKALGVKTIEDLANNKFIKWCQAMVAIAPFEKLKDDKPQT